MKKRGSFNQTVFSLTAVALFVQSSFVQANSGTPLGQGRYYDNQRISELAESTGRASVDAGYPLIDDFSTLKVLFRGSQFGLTNKAITSGMWWMPLLADFKKNAPDSSYLSPLIMHPNPLRVRLTDEGCHIGIPTQNVFADNELIHRHQDNTLELLVTTGDLKETAPLVKDYSDWMVEAQWAKEGAPLLTAQIIEGSPFVFIEKNNQQQNSLLQFTEVERMELIYQENGLSLFRSTHLVDGLAAPPRVPLDHYYAYFSDPNVGAPTWKWKDTTGQEHNLFPGRVLNRHGQVFDQGQLQPIQNDRSLRFEASDAHPYFSVAIIPALNNAAAIQMAKQFKPYAYTTIKKTRVSHEYDKQTAQVITHFNFDTQTLYDNPALKKQPLVMVFPWQIKNMPQNFKMHCLFNECAGTQGVIKTLKGNMHLYAVPNTSDQTASFTIHVPYRGVLPVLPNKLSPEALAKMGTYSFELTSPALNATNFNTDTYAVGKLLTHQTQLIKMADALMHSGSGSDAEKYRTIRDNLLTKLKGQVNSFLTGLNHTGNCQGNPECLNNGKWFYAYNNKWHTVLGFPSGFFTATTLTDHAFHWGYLIDAAATIAQFDKTWAQQYGGMVNLIIRDLYNYNFTENEYNSEGPRLPHFRSFDPYLGLSSALGLIHSGRNSLNEEDSAEFMHFAQGIILWGLNTHGVQFEGDNTSPETLVEAGIYLYATEDQGLSHYHFNLNPDSGVFPPGWGNSQTGQIYQLVANVYGNSQARANYFGPAPSQHLASNLLPVTAGSLYMGQNPEFVQKVYDQDALTPCTGSSAGDTNSFFCGTLLKYLALANPTRAASYFTQYFETLGNPISPYETNESKASVYYWIQTLKSLGALNSAITADTPAYAAFGTGNSMYVAAYNNETSPKTVNFYYNGAMVCSIQNIEPGMTKAQHCGGNSTE